jgi:hypothetical protein
MTNKHIKAREVPPSVVSERRAAEVSTRPLKLAFVINEELPLTELLKVIEFNSIIWGGYYNLLVPSNGIDLTSSWWQAMLAHNPDKIILCGKISDALVLKMHTKVEPFCIWLWTDEILSNQHVEGNAFDSIPMVYKLLQLQETQGVRSVRLGVPKISPGAPYFELLAARFGLLPESYVGMYFKSLQAEWMTCDSQTFEGYLGCIKGYDRATPIETTALDFSPVTYGGPSGFTIVVAANNPLSDLCLFWNLRRRPSLGRLWVVAIPHAALSKRANVEALANWCNEVLIGTNFVVLASSSLSKSVLLGLRKKLAPRLKKQIEHVDVCCGSFDLNSIRTVNTRNKETLQLEQQAFRIKMPLTTLGEQIQFGEWVADVELGERRVAKFQPPAFSGLSRLLADNPPDWHVRSYGLMARLDDTRISYRVRQSQEMLAGVIPGDDAIFISLVKSKGYQAVTTDKCRYARGLIRLIGGQEELIIWRDVGVRDLFYRMSSARECYTPREMMTLLKPGREKLDESYSMIANLALRQIFLRGYKIHCPACDLTRWYEIADITEAMSCAGCLTRLQPPLEAAFHYRLNDLVARGLEQGTMSVALTLLFLKALSMSSFMYVPGVEVHKLLKTDIDIIGSCDGHLFIAECKDLRDGASASTINSVLTEFVKLIELALSVGAEMVFLSVLRPDVPEVLEKKIEALKKKHKNSVAIHLLTSIDLEKGRREKPISKATAVAYPEMQPSPWTVYDFLPIRRDSRKHWVRDTGDRAISF